MATAHATPTLEHENRLWRAGFRHVAGLDEAGRGALAGPVVAAAVIVPPGADLGGVWAIVRDSKLLTPKQRSAMELPIQSAALAWGVGAASAATIDDVGIAAATRLAMRQAVSALSPPPDYLLIDWVRLPQVNLPQESLTHADARIVSVAAASILAKVHRDRLLIDLARRYPDYGFHGHKGYGAASHLAAIAQYGPCPEHRHSFAPLSASSTLFDLDELGEPSHA